MSEYLKNQIQKDYFTSISKFIIYNNILYFLALTQNIIQNYIQNDNKKITSLLKKLFNIYNKNQKRIIQKYFLKYYYITIKLKYNTKSKFKLIPKSSYNNFIQNKKKKRN